ncbi:MAG: hypothetical protein Q8R47_06455 [Nanoarchaeota archaeon]|nr:hypothetical protein [Nanoarchaeota archaeon]
MVRGEELRARIKDYFSFEKQELAVLIPAIFITAFMFSFCNWGQGSCGEGDFHFWTGFWNLMVASIIAAISFFARFSWQKIYALKDGYLAQFKGWWTGILVALILTIVTNGRVPLVLIGGVVSSLMVRQRLGEFRYGHSYLDNAKISFHGIAANLFLALLFAIGLYFSPESYFFGKGLWLNWVMALCAAFPLPQLDGLNIYFGSRPYYYTTLALVAIFGILLLTQTQIGLILAIFVTTIAIIVGVLIEP